MVLLTNLIATRTTLIGIRTDLVVMRINLIVTRTEFIVTRTDLIGILTDLRPQKIEKLRFSWLSCVASGYNMVTGSDVFAYNTVSKCVATMAFFPDPFFHTSGKNSDSRD